MWYNTRPKELIRNYEAMKTKSRHGQHHEDLVGFSGYITPELKAIAQVTANELEMTMMDLFRDGINKAARQVGILQADGNVSEKYRPVVDAYVDAYKTRKQLNKKEKDNA